MSAKEAEARYRGSHSNRKHEPEPTKKRGGTSEKAKTLTWPDVVKGPKIRGELETTNSNKSRNESKSNKFGQELERVENCRFRSTNGFGRT